MRHERTDSQRLASSRFIRPTHHCRCGISPAAHVNLERRGPTAPHCLPPNRVRLALRGPNRSARVRRPRHPGLCPPVNQLTPASMVTMPPTVMSVQANATAPW